MSQGWSLFLTAISNLIRFLDNAFVYNQNSSTSVMLLLIVAAIFPLFITFIKRLS